MLRKKWPARYYYTYILVSFLASHKVRYLVRRKHLVSDGAWVELIELEPRIKIRVLPSRFVHVSMLAMPRSVMAF